jgi:hypothetical protein
MLQYKIKISTREGIDGKWMLCQTKGGKGISKCGKYHFFLNEEIENPDFWVVRGKGITQEETCMVAPENTILLLSEPRSIINYPKRYRAQFGMLCSCQKELKHKNIRYTPAILPWFVGVSQTGKYTCTMDYDALKAMDTPPKSKLISVVTSNKAFTKGHQNRIKFVEHLKKHYGDQLDVFGRGYKTFDDKWEALAPYKYHIAIENYSDKYYWTEKLSDCYLTETYPIYYGCTNIDDYFPKGSYTPIDIRHADEAISIIDETIKKNEFENNLLVLKQCKELVLEKYNLFDMIAAVCDELDPKATKHKVTMKPAVSSLDWHNIYLYFFAHNYYRLKMSLAKMFRTTSVLTQSHS